MAKHTKRSVAPIYFIGLTWLVYAFLFPLNSLIHYLVCGVLSAVAFVVGKAIFPDKVYELKDEKPKEEKKQEKTTTGNPEIDALIKERDRALSEMRRLNDAIADEKISAQIDHLEEVAKKIIDHVVDHPKKLPQIRRFMDYYLPTTLKILNAYDRMDSTGIAGDNISTTKAKVEGMMDTITQAYDKQLDSLFGEEALDISTDITVMENLLAREGFGSMNINNMKQEADREITLEL